MLRFNRHKCCTPGPNCSPQLRLVNNFIRHLLPATIKRSGKLAICCTCYLEVWRSRHKIASAVKEVSVPGPSSSFIPLKTASNDDNEQSDVENVCENVENLKKAKLFDEWMAQLRNKFKQLDKRSDKVQLLSMLPKSMTVKEVQNEFNTTMGMVRAAKDLQIAD